MENTTYFILLITALVLSMVNTLFIYNSNESILNVTKGVTRLVCENQESFSHSNLTGLCEKQEEKIQW